MSKTIERNVFVGFDSIPGHGGNPPCKPKYMEWNNDGSDCIKDEPGYWYRAKLIIEIPEKSVTITESQFDEAMDFMRKQSLNAWVDTAKQKLFGEERK